MKIRPTSDPKIKNLPDKPLPINNFHGVRGAVSLSESLQIKPGRPLLIKVAATWPPKTDPRPFCFLPPAGLSLRFAPEFHRKWPT